MTQEPLQYKSHRFLIMTRYGKIVFSEEASQSLGLGENSAIKLGVDNNCSTHYISISLSDTDDSLKLKTSGVYRYIVSVGLLKLLGLYGSDPTIYQLVKKSDTNGKSVFKLDKILTVKDPKIGGLFPNKDELRSVLAMLNAKNLSYK